jgi:hypothetical protein
VEALEQFADRRIQFDEASDPMIAQTTDEPTLDEQP